MRTLIAEIEAEILRLKWLTALNNLETVVRRYSLAHKAGFRPDQPRDEVGRWTSEGGNSGSVEARVSLASGRVPQIPQRRPPTTREQNLIARGLARVSGLEGLSAAITTAVWLKDFTAVYVASFDPPKTLAELQDAVSNPWQGYDRHHIVERATAAEDGTENHLINARENLVRIPRWKHWDLNSWYEKENDEFENKTPREYLRGQSWEERYRVGLRGLIEVGVLKP